MIKRICSQCKKEFDFRGCPTDISSGRGKFCSNKCKTENQRTLPKEFKCEFCGKIFPNKFGKIKKFCSKLCADKSRIGVTPWNKGIKTPLLVREKQSNARMGKEPWNKGIEWLEMRGENNPFWKGGISARFRMDLEYINWRKNVLTKDNYICQMCGVRGGKLIAHHIKDYALYPDLRRSIDNGMAVCGNCHSIIHQARYALNTLIREGKLEKREFKGQIQYRYILQNECQIAS